MRNAGRLIRRAPVIAGAALSFAAAFSAPPLAGDESLDGYRAQGLQAARATGAALGRQLAQAIEAGGPEGAVAFCHTRANPITEATSQDLGMEVRRVSDRPRNPNNAASETEQAIIAAFRDALARGEQPLADVREADDGFVGYYPIVTNAMCLQCHGTKGADISPATQAVLDHLYPDDRATGYAADQLRGLFVITMKRRGDDPGAAM